MILVPYRPDGGRRDQLWTFTHAWLEARHPDYAIYVGASPEGLFNRSAAINAAAVEAGDWDVAVVCDSDTVVPAAQLEEAVATAHRTGLLTSALSKVVELSRESTDLLLSGVDADVTRLKKDRTRTKDDMTQSSVLAVPRSLWDAVGGFDEEFCGWGCEDNAFWLAATVFGGGDPIRVQGSAFHLWHELASKIKLFDPVFRSNFWRLRHYKKAETPTQLAMLRNA
ncbi:hypothetical protein CIW49_07185 [Mycolicibacterium sp. P1-18]|nr:hypothetical protein CIW49_07185 [Mycolicibacterium sp. P1-18]